MNIPKLILVDGVFGSGKSTTAEFIFNTLKNMKIKCHKYEEENNDTPAYFEYCENVIGTEQVYSFINEAIKSWEMYKKNKSDRTDIIESSYLQNTVRILFQNNLENEEIFKYVEIANNILRELNPLFIYITRSEIEKSILDIWNERNKEFEDYCIRIDENTEFSKKRKINGRAATIKLWDEYQKLTNSIFISCPFAKYSIETGSIKIEDKEQRIHDILYEMIPG